MLNEPNLKEAKRIILEERNLGAALHRIHAFLADKQWLSSYANELEAIENDYQLMCDFMLRGFRDEKRSDLYDNLLRKTYRVACDLELQFAIRGANSSLREAGNTVGQQNVSPDSIRQRLEGFVQEAAMLSLESEESTTERREELAFKHQQYVNWLFDLILVSPQWNEGLATSMSQLILSPTIDSIDARMMTCAIMLSAMNEFDVYKLTTLKDVYQQATDDYLKQRALVGFAFALPMGDYSLFEPFKQVVNDFCNNEDACRELLELQMQIFYCMNTDRDNAAIQRDIIPTIMKNNNFRVTRFGIEEKEDDPMQDILHPDADDKAMEELEKSISKMMEMQKAGSDIYFGGFSQMKRFSFFYTLSNWFIPFYLDHPGISQARRELKRSRFLQILLDSGPFCDSDKYSFTLAMTSVIDKIPANMREMLDNREAIGPTMDDAERQSPAYIRRMYLQDLYRFFRVYQQKDDFDTPFDYVKNPNRFFFANPALADTSLNKMFSRMGRFLIKQKRHDCLRQMLERQIWPENDSEHDMLVALSAMNDGQFDQARQSFLRLVAEQPDNEQAIKGLAQASMRCGDFAEAEKNYTRLVDLHPDNRHYMLNLSIAQINNHKVDEGVKLLYRLNYENADDKNVLRALGWGLLVQKNIQQAENIYDTLLGMKKNEPMDYLNAGYCKWFAGKIEEAVGLFHRYTSADNSEKNATTLIQEAFNNDKTLLDDYEVSTADKAIMSDLIVRQQS
ncbi:MAG: tetratricopeptide repeat protein [Prevotella sp.]|nr:tetratricopeptide repeat protein [Prevotella sp.]